MTRKLKPRALERNSRNIKGRHEKLRVNRVDLAKELEKDKHDRKKPSETWTRLEEFGDFEDFLTFRRPNPYYILTLDATIVSCHLFDVFPTATKIKFVFSKLLFALCVSLLTSPTPPQTPGPNRGWMEIKPYFLDRWVNWRQTDVLRTWRITWRITL